MFQPAAGVRTQVQNEGVVVIGNLSEHRDFGGDDFLNFVAQTNRIVVAFAIDHDPMRYAAHLEVEFLEVADFNRRVVENVKVLGAKSIFLTNDGRQSGSDLPTRCRYDS